VAVGKVGEEDMLAGLQRAEGDPMRSISTRRTRSDKKRRRRQNLPCEGLERM
jgi:hypothetical protein